jgi:hypothetical protein
MKGANRQQLQKRVTVRLTRYLRVDCAALKDAIWILLHDEIFAFSSAVSNIPFEAGWVLTKNFCVTHA